jgi:hypothetical protein
VNFGFPLGLLALSALAPLAAAYFLRRRQKPRVVSALFLWRSPSQRAQAGPRFERFSREASIVLEALAVIAAALYLADLRLGASVEQRHLVLVVDGSLSLSARPPTGKPIAERVRDAAARAVTEEGATLVTVVESGAHPRILAGPQAPATAALSALEGWTPMGAAHDLVPSFLLGRELAGGNQRLWFFTDGPLPEGVAVPPQVQVVEVGEKLDNVALVSAQRRDEADLAQVTVRVASFAATPRAFEVEFHGPAADATRSGGADKKEKVELAPGASAVLRVSFRNASAIEVRLPDDALAADGHATLLPSPVAQVRASVLAGLGPAETAALSRFLDVAAGVTRDVTPEAPAELTFGPLGSAARVRFGAPGAQRTFVGPFFTQKGHPVLDDVGFGGVLWTAGQNPPGRPLVTAGDATLVSEDDDGTLYLNIELARSNLQRTSAWPILMANVLRRGRQAHPGLPKHQLMLGEEVPVVTEPGARFVLKGPGGERPVLGAGAVQLPPLAAPGRYTLERDGVVLDQLEALPLDPRESDLRERATAVVAAKEGADLATRALARKRMVWPLFLLLGLLLADFWVTARVPA